MFKGKKDPTESDKSRLGRLQEKLYSQNNPTLFRDRRSIMHETENSPETSWQEIEEKQEIEKPPIYTEPNNTLFSKFSHIILYTAIVFFVGTGAFTVYHFVWGSKTIQQSKILVDVQAPSFINGGEIFPIDVYVTNTNKSQIQKVDLVIEYPKGESISTQESADRVRIPLGDIGSGKTVHGTSDIILYGREGNVRDIQISLEYYTPGSYVIFKKNLTHSLTVKAAPVILTTEHLKEMASNEELSYVVHIKAERGIDLHNFLLNVDYPNGFQFISADPAPRFGNNVWSFDTIEKGKTVDVIIKGNVRGEDGDEKTFRVSGGSPDLIDSSKVGIVYADTKSSVVVQKPFISLRGVFEGARADSGEFAIRAGEKTGGYIEYENNVGDTISNVVVSAKFSGEILNRQRVIAIGGYYDSTTSTILWDRTTTPALASLTPGAKGILKFKIDTYPLGAKQNGYFSQPQVTVVASVKGKRLSDAFVPEQTAISSPIVAKIITEAGLRAEVFGADSPEASTLPVNAIREKETIYTLGIGILNRSNTLSNPEVSFVLPPNVKFLASNFPQAEKVTYNQDTREVTWLPDFILPDTGFGREQKKVYIRLSILPSLGDVGTKPALTNKIRLKATDSYSGIQITSETNTIFLPNIVE